jgi:hypothetical protein
MNRIQGEQISMFTHDHDHDHAIGDWGWEMESNLLPKIREQPNLVLLPKIRERNITDRSTPTNLLPKIREQHPAPEIREQLLKGNHYAGYSIVTVKSEQYYLTHANSDKFIPDKGWLDIKGKYLYVRWRSDGKQCSRCLGRIDAL